MRKERVDIQMETIFGQSRIFGIEICTATIKRNFVAQTALVTVIIRE